MANKPTIQIQRRNRTGSSAVKQLRREGRVPAVMYGRGEPEAISVDMHDFMNTIKPDHYGSAIVQLAMDGQVVGDALVKAVQANTLKGSIFHIDFQRISMEDRISVSVPLVLTGESDAIRAGGILDQPVHSVNMRCRADHVPDEVNFDTSTLDIAEVVHASQLAVPSGCELLDNPEEIVAVMLGPSVPALEETVSVQPDVAGPDLTGDKQQDDFPLER